MDPIGVALSGGGHRATLYGLGALMALVDRRVSTRIAQVSSVSGGSILNAFLVHQRVDLATVTSDDFDRMAGELTAIVTRRGVLSRLLVLSVLLTAAAAGSLGGVLYGWSSLPPGGAFLAVVLAAGLPLLGFGRFVSWRLGRVFFPSATATTIGTFEPPSVEHVFCATDLISGYPVYVSTCNDGVLWRRTANPTLVGGALFVSGRQSSGGHLPLADVVRASAGFPGIPPLRLRTVADGGAELTLLSDGGITNNLGTQALREDGFFRGRSDNPECPRLLLGANASAAGSRHRIWPYYIPGLAVVTQLVRCLQILNANTVGPRVQAANVALNQRSRAGAFVHPVDLLVSLTDEAGMQATSLEAGVGEDAATRLHQSLDYQLWTERLVKSIKRWNAAGTADADTLAGAILSHLADEPTKAPFVPGTVDPQQLNQLRSTSWWRDLRRPDFLRRNPNVPTTLGRLRPETARDLILQGYLHTYQASIALAPWSPDELDGPAGRIEQRVSAFAPD